MDLVCNDAMIGRYDFVCQPQKGETIQTEAGKYVVEDYCHNFPLNRLQVICSKVNDKPPAQPPKPTKRVEHDNSRQPTTVQP